MKVDANKIYTWANPAGLDFLGVDAIGKEAAYFFARSRTLKTAKGLLPL